ncbi:MAG: glycosyl hydrolase [Prevotella sp.]
MKPFIPKVVLIAISTLTSTFACALNASDATTDFEQQRSAKRGVCWDEKTQVLSSMPMEKMAPGISWLYTWGEAEKNADYSIYDSNMAFLPMCWNGSFDETKLRNYLTARNGKVKYLLAFNEPNLSTGVGGSAMTPKQAADTWPKIEKIAEDFGLQIVAPALNFTGDKVGGRTWQPFEWYDEFFRLVPNAKIDYLAFHSYMNYYSAVDWIASRYFYSDIDTKDESDLMGATNRALYPNLVKFMDNYFTANGHYPRMFLTEFCSWETNSYPYQSGLTRDFQIDQMTQKIQALEKSDNVAAYAWFMANPSKGESEFPYMSLFKSNKKDSELSDLGLVYIYMSSFNKAKYYAVGETIHAKDYVDASTDEHQIKVRPNSETDSETPLQVEWQSGAWAAFQIDIPEDGNYTISLHINSTKDNTFQIFLNALGSDNKILSEVLPSTDGIWTDVTLTVKLNAGKQCVILKNAGTGSVLINKLKVATSTAIHLPTANTQQDAPIYTISGTKATTPNKNTIYISNKKKYIMSE